MLFNLLSKTTTITLIYDVINIETNNVIGKGVFQIFYFKNIQNT